MRRWLRGFLSAMALLLAALPLRADEITVFAAASLSDALAEVAAGYREQTGTSVVLSFAGSSALAWQIRNGAPADLFVSANPGWMDALSDEGLLVPGTRTDLLSNSLVLIGHEDGAIRLAPDMDLAGALGESRLAMALVDAVPAGIYGRAALTALGQWEAVKSHVVQADNVRAALRLVALGEAAMGIVYATDADAEPGVHVLGTFPANSHPPIVYPAAAIEGADGNALHFLNFLQSPVARTVFASHGFTVPEGGS